MRCGRFVSLALVLAFAMALMGVCDGSLSSMIAKKEAETVAIADKARELFEGRCTFVNNCNGGKCSDSPSTRTSSVPQCGNEHGPGNSCTDVLGGDSETCTHCSKSKLQLDYDEGYMRAPLGIDSASKEEAAAEAMCWMRGLNDVYVRQDKERQNDGYLRAWQYFGSHQAGVTNMYPGISGYGGGFRNDTGCLNYDPRRRPWYVAASSGPKDIVLVLDTSGSMSQTNAFTGESRLSVLKSATLALLNTLTQNDFSAVVEFSNTNRVLMGQSQLRRSTPSYIESLEDEVDKMTASGGTKFIQGLDKALNILQNSGSDSSSGCQKLIVFLTDGVDNDLGQNTNDANWNAVITRLTNANVKVVSFSMGTGADSVMPKDLACRTGGVWEQVADGTNPTAAMVDYYEMLALSVAGTGIDNVIWSSPYEDAGGLGMMISAAKAVYDSQHNLIGVASTDVLMRELEEFGGQGTVLNELISRSRVCPSFQAITNFTCPAWRIRQACTNLQAPAGCSANEDNTPCRRIKMDSALCENVITASALEPSGGYDKIKPLVCCQCINLGLIIGLSVGGFVLLVIIMVVCYKSSRCPLNQYLKRRQAVGRSTSSSSDRGATAPSAGQMGVNNAAMPRGPAYPSPVVPASGGAMTNKGYVTGLAPAVAAGPSMAPPSYNPVAQVVAYPAPGAAGVRAPAYYPAPGQNRGQA